MWYACARACSVASVSSDSLRFPHRLYASRLLCPWNFPGKKTCVGCHAFLQGIFPTQRLNPGVPHCRQILYCLRHQGSPLKCFAIWPNSERVCFSVFRLNHESGQYQILLFAYLQYTFGKLLTHD